MALVYDEFNDAVIGADWTDNDSGGGVSSESEGKLKQTQQTGEQCLLQQPALAVQSYDIWVRAEMPPVDYVAGKTPDIQIWFEDTDSPDGIGGVYLRYDTVVSAWQVGCFILTNGYGESYDENVEIFQNYIYMRLKLTWSSPNMTVQAYYSLTEPALDADWIEIGPITVTTPWKPTVAMSLYIAGNPDNASVTRTYFVSYLRPWYLRGVDAAESPGLEQYQRLQGYPKVTHPLVFNRNIGEFEVMEQPRSLSPSPTVDASFVLAYNGSGNLSTVTKSVGGISYVKTLTYTGDDLTGVSVWVEL